MQHRKGIYIIVALLVLIAGCKTQEVPIDGKTAYSLKQYSTAPELLQKDFGSEKDPVKKREIAYQIADSYHQYNNIKSAADWYQKAADLGSEESLYKLGQMQMMQEQYDEAIKTFTKFAGTDATSKNRAEGPLRNCRNALAWKQAFTKTQVTNLAYVNTPQSDFSPILYKGRLVFSSSRNEAKGDMLNAWTGEKSADIFITDLKPGSKIESFSDSINTKDYEGTCTFSKDGNEIYFTRCKVVDESDKKNKPSENEYCHVYHSRLYSGAWSEPELVKLFADTVNVGQPALSKDGKYLFVSSDLKAGFGGKDIYYFTKSDSGWAGPNNAGTYVNSAGDEMFPWLDERNNLYFASNGLPGMGGLDIFKAVKGKTLWKDATNLKAPINSGGDDFGYIIEKYKPLNADDTILFAGYFTSNRPGGKGEDDIYRFEEKWVNFFVLKGKVLTKKYENPEDPDSKLLGMMPVPGARVELKNPLNDTLIAFKNCDKDGNYNFKLDAETNYKLSASQAGFLNKNETTSTKGLRNQDSTLITVYKDIEVEKIFPQKMIVIPNIYYDYDKATLRPESEAVLDSILVFFKDNKDLTIEIGSHTDSRGSDAYNLKLSQARAQSVVDYLIGKGIAPERLVAVGYGETKLVNRCSNGVDCTEEEHQKNRRTTFRIIGSKQKIESVEPDYIPVEGKPTEEKTDSIPEKK
jgi:outer membrane protein OmpA-like peptidoglycan-associated protein/tetratricopeptide (TPR) repeat protein